MDHQKAKRVVFCNGIQNFRSFGQFETRDWGSVMPLFSSDIDTGVEMMAHIALTSLCKDHLIATAALPIALLLIRN
jgi:hypothetical protein